MGGVGSFVVGVSVGVMLSMGASLVLGGREIRRMKMDYRNKSERYEKALSDLESLVRRASEHDGKGKLS
jgi:hypothetical protein